MKYINDEDLKNYEVGKELTHDGQEYIVAKMEKINPEEYNIYIRKRTIYDIIIANWPFIMGALFLLGALFTL